MKVYWKKTRRVICESGVESEGNFLGNKGRDSKGMLICTGSKKTD